MSGESVLQALGDISTRLAGVEEKVERIPVVEEKVDATREQTTKTNGRVTALEEAEIRRKAIDEERARVAAASRADDEDQRAAKTFKERWLDRAMAIVLTVGVAFLGSLLHLT